MANLLTKNTFRLDRVTGNFKPLMILAAMIVTLIVTLIKDCERYNQTYRAYAVNEIGEIGSEEVELTGFIFKPELIATQNKGGVALFSRQQDRTPAAILIVSDKDDFVKTFKEKGKVVVKQFFGGVTANSNEGVTEYVNDPVMKNDYNQYLKIFTFKEYFSWKTVLWRYLLIFLGIAFILIVLVSRIRVY